ncbi:enoyl-CoA hydratase/isomerase family protein [Micromonospora terminaliae]|uniref:Enoyl-CoA hydratase/isomerase family protein n=1 Tax=Micromonospora terminaliae TaxID=1914461 RepID=A0AAJ3DKU8_9ACTN|nr:enoyl-CoA-hydratase DpgB [Micromonospora terminaliae]NES30227.1 enoyl-CoA hydratase/isomerase family protein [Micromonospora terminaliae]QGL47006.1 enoyl-CoA hydratase/isomerase family protein [Micromonospora terminaliae]
MSAETVGRGEHYAANGTRGDVVLRIDGSKPLTTESVAAVEAACSAAESDTSTTMLAVQVTGTPGKDWTYGLEVALVSKWERALRRLERLGVTTVAVASGDCGGLALDVLLATDYRIATPDVRLSLHVDGDATWPGMAVFRLAQQSGGNRLRRAILFGAPLDAQDSLDLGLVDEVTDDLATALTATAEMVGGLSGRELAIRRQLMFDATTTSFEDALGRHLAACDRALRRSATTRTP